MNKYLTEFIGTFFLVLTIGCTLIPGNAGVIPPLAIGAALMVMIFAGGHVSGGHYNPAVAIGADVMKLLNVSSLWIHWTAEFTGGALAGLAFKWINPSDA